MKEFKVALTKKCYYQKTRCSNSKKKTEERERLKKTSLRKKKSYLTESIMINLLQLRKNY